MIYLQSTIPSQIINKNWGIKYFQRKPLSKTRSPPPPLKKQFNLRNAIIPLPSAQHTVPIYFKSLELFQSSWKGIMAGSQKQGGQICIS